MSRTEQFSVIFVVFDQEGFYETSTIFMQNKDE
jgi:hypothetical protein